MKYLVTGANGQLGNALKEILPESETLFTDVDELDVTDKDAVFKTVREYKPKVVFHCAAMTNVDGNEANEDLADKINHRSVEYFAEVCGEIDAVLFYVSTDYVFKGDAKEPYKVDDKTNPQSVYGKTKLAGEEAAKKASKYYIFRTSWVYGDGHNFVKTMLSLSEKMSEIKVVDDQVGRPTYAIDLAKAMVEAVEKKIPYGIYHFQNSGEPISWASFAKEIFKITGKSTKVIPISTEEYLEMNNDKQVAPRPSYSVLDNSVTRAEGFEIPIWGNALKKYCKSSETY